MVFDAGKSSGQEFIADGPVKTTERRLSAKRCRLSYLNPA
jgi:hypothetical protein